MGLLGSKVKSQALSRTAGVQAIYVIPEDSVQTTFGEDELLPSLPLPSLEHTMDRFIDSCRPFCDEAGMQEVHRVAKEFASSEGAELDTILRAKAAKSRNWIERWWEEAAYLSNRDPLVPFCSMTGSMALDELYWATGEGRQIKHAAMYAHHLTMLWQLMREERLVPTQSADRRTVFSMNQFRRLFNCARVPQPSLDRLDIHFRTAKEGRCPSHVLVVCRCGRLYRVEALRPDGVTPLTPPEWERQLEDILGRCNKEPSPPSIAVLTCDNRDSWARNYAHLRKLSPVNEATLADIESSLFALVLDGDQPDPSEGSVGLRSLSGNFGLRWADKSLMLIFYGNGAVGGLSDHTAYDGMISVAALFYVYTAIQDTQGVWPTESDAIPTRNTLVPPKEYCFVLDDMLKAEVERVHRYLEPNHWAVCMAFERYRNYGKTFIQKHRLHPDSFVQMALQLTYYKMHGKPAPTYETATTRAYYNGRTETMRSCTSEQMEWVRAMLDPAFTVSQRASLLRRAIARHDQLMTEARSNAGCDRHLLGLYMTAVETGRPVPALYSHPAYIASGGGGNFVLSTSLVGYTPVGGGVAPMCRDGYGCFYSITTDCMQLTVTVLRVSYETSAVKFASRLTESLDEMAQLLVAESMPSSKL